MKQNRLLSAWLDLVRFSAAVAVVFGHAKLHAFGGHGDPGLSAPMSAILLTSEFSHLAVIIFFVISGYPVGGKLFAAARPGFAAKYLLDRATRIYTVAIPALAIGFLAMLAQQAAYGQAYQLTSNRCADGPDRLLGSLLFLHKGFMPNPCFNGPVWSLVYEVFYYLFFAAVALALLAKDRRLRLGSVVVAVALGAYGLLEPEHLWAYSTVWLLGMAAAQPRPLRPWQLLFTAAVLAAFLAQTYLRFGNPVVRHELAVTSIMVASILMFQRWTPIDPGATAAKLLQAGAAMSYSLYMFHAPAMNLLRGVAEGSFAARLGRPLSSGTPFWWYPAFILVGCVAGALFWWCFERRTMEVRIWLERRLGIANPSAHQPIPANLVQAGEPVLPARAGGQVAQFDNR